MSKAGTAYKERMKNYDWLRTICAIAIIMIHVSATYFNAALKESIENNGLIETVSHPFIISIYDSISRFAVPCFVMLSGAFVLDDKKNLDYRRFYIKSFERLGVPTIIFTLLYTLYQFPLCFIREDGGGIDSLIKSVVAGAPMYHMWYMYMIIGVYVMAPIVLHFKDSISESTFYNISFVFLAWACVSGWTTGKVRLNWSIGLSFEYLGYFMVGYSIRKLGVQKNNYKAALLIISGLLIELCAAGLSYQQHFIAGVKNLKYEIVSPMAPLIVVASVLIFWGFTKLNIKHTATRTAGITFEIYLIHAGVWHLISNLLKLAMGEERFVSLNSAIWIPIFVVMVFVISVCLSRIYLWIWDKLDKGKRITQFLEHILHLTEK